MTDKGSTWGEYMCGEDGLSPRAQALNDAMRRANDDMRRNLDTALFNNYQPGKPMPRHKRIICAARRSVGEKMADLASWVAGYDVRGEW